MTETKGHRIVREWWGDRLDRNHADLVAAIDEALAPQSVLPPDLAAIRARCEAATEGPWSAPDDSGLVFAPNAKAGGETIIAEPRGWGYFTGRGSGGLGLSAEEAAKRMDANRVFIAHARQDIPALLTALTAAMAEGSKHLDDVLMLQGFCDDRDKQIATLTSQLSAARAALKPFAKVGAELGPGWKDEQAIFSKWFSPITYGDLRRAAQATAGDAP